MDAESDVLSLIRIVLIDFETITRAALRLLIESCPRYIVVGEAGAYDDALAAVEGERPDIVLLEPISHGESHIELIAELDSLPNAARIIVLTSECEAELHRVCIRKGAMGIVLKDQAVEVLMKAIRKVHAGEMWMDRTMTAGVIAEMRSERSLQDGGCGPSKANALTNREREIIALVAEGLNNQQIAEHLFLSKATVRHHITSIFSKLEVTDRIGLLIYSFRHGLVEPPRRLSRPA